MNLPMGVRTALKMTASGIAPTPEVRGETGKREDRK
jgi:hypothetical protein